MTRLSCCTFLLLPLCAPGWTGPAAGDLLPPTVVITGPSDTTCYASSASTITLSGYAGDDTGIVSATWANDREGSGSFSPAAHWAVTDIDLAPGLNVITVSVYDASGRMGGDRIAVVYAPTVLAHISSAKRVDSGYVYLAGKTVSAVYAGFFYIQEADRSCGLKVRPIVMPRRLAVGQKVDIAGTLRTDANGERCIDGAVNAPRACEKSFLWRTTARTCRRSVISCAIMWS